jgi:serine-type D-Ala-D-Ala endopeptidase (penicillin-binding protein 7)
MLLRARRVGAFLLLLALTAFPTMRVEAASRTPHSRHSTVHRSSPKPAARAAATRRKRHGHRIARRGPTGAVYARNAIIMDPATDRVLYEKASESTVPIASLTKLMTALVFLEQKPDLRRDVEVTHDEIYGGGHTQLRNHERVSLYDLLHMSLMCSDNVATRVIARESGLSADAFVAHMNDKARLMGLTNTHYVEPTGLDERNVSTAADVAKLLGKAQEHYLVREITTTPTYVFTSASPIRTHQIVSTNRLLRSGRYEVNCGKTGYINESGYCFATSIRNKGRDLIAVVLGAPTAATRFADVIRLVQRTENLGITDTRP